MSGDTLTRFFTFHFILPFLLLALVVIHIFSLHITGSSSPLGVPCDLDKVPFHPYFSSKDMVGWLIAASAWLGLSLARPWILGDPENFLEANPLVTPVHIKPEWYFLFVYAILRSVPNKLGGVLGLAGSVLVAYALALTPPRELSIRNHPALKVVF